MLSWINQGCYDVSLQRLSSTFGGAPNKRRTDPQRSKRSPEDKGKLSGVRRTRGVPTQRRKKRTSSTTATG